MRSRKKIKNPGEKKKYLLGEEEGVRGHILAYLYLKRRRVSALMNITDKASLAKAI